MAWWSRLSVRGRLTFAVTVASAVALLTLSWLTMAWLRQALVNQVEVRNSAALEATYTPIKKNPNAMIDKIEQANDFGPLPTGTRLELGAVPSDTLAAVAYEPATPAGLVATDGDEPPVDYPILGRLLPGDVDSDEYLVSSDKVIVERGKLTVQVATSLSDVNRSVAVVRTALWVVVPTFVLAVGMGSWVMTGRSLEPVAALRRRVAEITSRTLDERVPVPPTDDEVAHLARTMNAMLDRLEASSRRERQFVSDAGHELRSPVAAIRAQVETALAYPATADWNSVGATVLAQGERLDRLVSDLFTLARLEEGAFGPVPDTEVDLDELVLEQLDHLKGRRLDLSGLSAARVHGDAGQLASVVRNLVENAGRHASEVVRVSVSSDGERARMVVEDDGPGVPPDQRDLVFERFGRMEEARSRDHGGAGLGLPLASRIVARHGGTLELDDSELGGARFVVTLPVVATDDH